MQDTSNRSSLLISGGAGDCKIYVTDCETGTPVRIMTGHSGASAIGSSKCVEAGRGAGRWGGGGEGQYWKNLVVINRLLKKCKDSSAAQQHVSVLSLTCLCYRSLARAVPIGRHSLKWRWERGELKSLEKIVGQNVQTRSAQVCYA